MIVNGNKITADTGKVLCRKADKWLAGNSVSLGMCYNYTDGRILQPAKQELPEDYEEVTVIDIEGQQIVINATEYDMIVTELIRYKYTLDAELALVNNYQWDSEKYKDEYTEFQKWRSACKDAARYYLASEDDKASV